MYIFITPWKRCGSGVMQGPLGVAWGVNNERAPADRVGQITGGSAQNWRSRPSKIKIWHVSQLDYFYMTYIW